MSISVHTEWMSGPHFNDNGTYMSDQELLDGEQPAALNALVINKCLDKSAEMESRFRVEVANDMGKGTRLDTSA